MNKKLKRICSVAMAVAITAASAMNTSVLSSYVYKPLSIYSDYTVIDDKGMLNGTDGESIFDAYKILYKEGSNLYKANPKYEYLQFVLSDSVKYEDVNAKVEEIFKEFYPNGFIGSPLFSLNSEEYKEYIKDWKPSLTFDESSSTYTVVVDSGRIFNSIDESEKIVAAKKSSESFMKKLNDEKLISAFYDFGEVYDVNRLGFKDIDDLCFSSDTDVNLIKDYIIEHNINCTIEEDICEDGFLVYRLNYTDDTDFNQHVSNMADIYEATSAKLGETFLIRDSTIDTIMYGKNSLEDIAEVTTPAETEPATTETTTVSTTAATTITTATSNTTLTTITAPAEEIKPVGDADGDNEVTVRDCSFIAVKLAKNDIESLPQTADYNKDGFVNVRDPAAIARDIAKVNFK